MRDESLEMELYIGRGILDNLFDHERVDPTVETITLSFPERWMNIVEERSLYGRIVKYCPNVKTVTIKTQSVYIIQTTPAGSCFIVKSQEELLGHPLPQDDDPGRLWYPLDTIIDLKKGLNVL